MKVQWLEHDGLQIPLAPWQILATQSPMHLLLPASDEMSERSIGIADEKRLRISFLFLAVRWTQSRGGPGWLPIGRADTPLHESSTPCESRSIAV